MIRDDKQFAMAVLAPPGVAGGGTAAAGTDLQGPLSPVGPPPVKAAAADLRSTLAVVHRALRGRYALTTVLSVVGGLAAAYAGWKLSSPTYHSEGLLRIAYTLPEVIQETDQNAPLQMFDTFMMSQRMLITSRRVIDMAVQDPIWKATGRPVPEKPDRYFAEHLNVEVKPRSEFLLITVNDPDPGTAAAAVTAVTNAYTELYSAQDKQIERQRTGVLGTSQDGLNATIEKLTEQLKANSREYGTSNLDAFYDAAASRLFKLDGALADVRVAIAGGASGYLAASTQPAAAQPPAGARPAPPLAPPSAARDVLTPERAAVRDPEMRRLLDLRARAEDELQRMRNVGLLESNRSVVAGELELGQAKARILKRMDGYQDYQSLTGQDYAAAAPVTPGTSQVATAGKSLVELKAEEERLGQLREDAKREMVALGNKRLELQQIQRELNINREQWEKLKKRSDVLQAEGAIGGRLSVISSGEIPLSPDKDPRRRWAAAAGMLGMCLPTASFVGLGLLRRRYDFSDEPAADVAHNAPLLGIIPELITDNEEDRRAAAHSVHQIRVLLRSRAARRSTVYLVTSAAAREGKTSVTMSLGLSFAASGLRTLVIDCDLVGRHLTSGFDADGRTGLREALDAGSVQRQVHRTYGGLHVLTAGGFRTSDAHALSSVKVGALLADARKYFEVILVDTGPLLGSVEAAMLAGEADEAIVVISRGQNRGPVQNAMQRLRSLGVQTAGFVYNRAKPQDFAASPYGSSSYRSVAAGDRPTHATPAGDPHRGPGDENVGRARLAGFGPLVKAVGDGLGWHLSN